jgi:hypothetical protein
VLVTTRAAFTAASDRLRENSMLNSRDRVDTRDSIEQCEIHGDIQMRTQELLQVVSKLSLACLI